MLSINSNRESFLKDKRALLFGVVIVAATIMSFLMLSKMITGQKYIFLGGLVLLTLYALLPLQIKMVLLVLGCLFPLSFGNFGPIPTFLWAEWMGPLIFCIMLYHVVLNQEKIFPEKCFPVLSAIFVLVVWAAINYLRHPVLAEKLMGVSDSAGGLRSYFLIFVGVCIFLSGLWFSRYWEANQSFWKRVLWTIVILSILLGILRIFSYFFSFDIPFVYSTYRYGGEYGLAKYGGTAYRIGGLSEPATIGISALLALKSGKSLQLMDVLMFLCFGFFLFLSGGRSATVGLLVALAFYGFILNMRYLAWIFAGLSLLSGVIWFLVSSDVLTGQINRLFALEGGIRSQDKYRSLTYRYMWEGFLVNPIFGRGIGYYGKGFGSTTTFAFGQLKAGGHGSYLSILHLFGLGGIYFLGVTLFSSVLKGISLLRKDRYFELLTNEQQTMVSFIVLILIIRSLEYIAGGNGFSDRSLFCLAGILAGFYSKTKNESYNEKT